MAAPTLIDFTLEFMERYHWPEPVPGGIAVAVLHANELNAQAERRWFYELLRDVERAERGAAR